MTKEEEAIKNIKEHCYFANLIPQAKEALDMAIKALEQEPLLDKIRAEIEKEIIPRESDEYDYEAKWQNMGLRMALKVINKYRK